MNDRTAPRVWPPFESRRSPSYLYCNTYGVNSTKWGGGRPHRPWRLTQVFDLCTDPKLRVMIRWHEIKKSRPKMKCFRWVFRFFGNLFENLYAMAWKFLRIPKNEGFPPKTFHFWSGYFYLMSTNHNPEFWVHAQIKNLCEPSEAVCTNTLIYSIVISHTLS